MMLMAMVLAGTVNVWGGVLLEDDFTGNNVIPNPAKWTYWNSGATYLSNDMLYCSNMEEVRTVPTFDVTVPGQPITFDVDLVSRNESTGGTDAWMIKVTDTANTNYLKLRVWGFTGGWGVYGHEISLKLVTDSGETNLFNDQLYTGSNNPGPFHVTMTVDATNVRLLVTGNLLGSGILSPIVAHGASLGSIFFHLTDSNYEWVRFDNAKVSTQASSLKGTVVLGDYTGDMRAIGAKIEFRQSGSVVKTIDQLLNPDGTFLMYGVDGVPPGTYNVALKTYNHLQKVLSGITVLAQPQMTDLATITLTAGDNDGDNEVTSTDLATVLGNME